MSEAALQIAVKQYLTLCLPDDVEWTASSAGVTLGASKAARMRQGAKAKAMGLRKGWPDLQFLFADGVTRFIELKTETGSLQPEQREFRDRCKASGRDIWAMCRSLNEVIATLSAWGVALKPHPFGVAA